MAVDTYISEIAALRRKLDSKEEALLILSEQLTNCTRERDELKNISRNNKFYIKESSSLDKYAYQDTDSFQALKEKNRALFIEIMDLRHKLQEAYSDLKVIRSEKADSRRSLPQDSQLKAETFLESEVTQRRLDELNSQLTALTDNEDELRRERDAYMHKYTRLYREFHNLMRAPSCIDIDGIMMETRYAKERMEQALSELEMARRTIAKYKGMLEKKRSKGSVKLGSGEEPGCRVITHKQVVELLDKEERSLWGKVMMNKEGTLSDLRGLCVALVESVQDKSLSLAHQKKTNRMLAERVKYLEEKLSKHEHLNPSEVLLQESTSLQEDTLVQTDDVRNEGEISEIPAKEQSEEEPNAINIICNTTEEEDKLPPELEDLVNRALKEVQVQLNDTI